MDSVGFPGRVEFGRWGSFARAIVKNTTILLLIDDALRCFVEEWNAPFWAYQTARQHAERYDSRYGTGLIPTSADAVQDIVVGRRIELSKAAVIVIHDFRLNRKALHLNDTTGYSCA